MQRLNYVEMLVEVLPITVDDDLMVKTRILFDGEVTLFSVPTEIKITTYNMSLIGIAFFYYYYTISNVTSKKKLHYHTV